MKIIIGLNYLYSSSRSNYSTVHFSLKQKSNIHLKYSHQKALDIGIEVNDNLLSLFDKGLAQCLRELDADVVVSDETVSFSHNVLERAKEKLIDLANLDSYSLIMETNHAEFKKIKENSYYWKTNSENNEKTFRKQLQAPL